MKKIIAAILFIIFTTGSPSIVSAMNYSIGYQVDDTGDSRPHSISMTGKIEGGDYEKLLSFIRANPYDVFTGLGVTKIQSNGGDLVEAIKIGKLLKTLRARVFAEECISACFFIYVMAPTHLFSFTGASDITRSLGVHRPYFDKQNFAKLSPKQAELRYEELEKNARDVLVSAKVPQNLIDKMFSVPSSDVYFLTYDEKVQLGMFHPAFEELVIAKCGDAKTADAETLRARWQCINKIEYRESFEGMNTVMSGANNPKWEKLKKFIAKKMAEGGY